MAKMMQQDVKIVTLLN
uniref:Uncharacterized protein n=2 Tax=Moniliophthora roreri TaxID=221103 RepID=A0A0W0FD84_MONRR